MTLTERNMTNIIQFPTPERRSTPINPTAMMDFALAWDIDTEEQLMALNTWMVQLETLGWDQQGLNDLLEEDLD
jgi:hypothetical protein